jgi:hypothetical protein
LKAAKHAEDVWAQKSGDSEDIALLYLAMLRAAGLTAYAMKVVNRQQGVFGRKMCPFQTMHWSHSAAGGVRQISNGTSLSYSPFQAYATNSLDRFGDITLDDHGAVTAALRFNMSGQDALRWRQISLKNDPVEVKKQFDEWLQTMVPDGVEAHVDHFLGLETLIQISWL